jgi:hypothetical protein
VILNQAGGTGPVDELARFLVNQPTALAALLAQHVDDGSGHCRTCRIGNQNGFQAWPCTLHAAADLAARSSSGEGSVVDAAVALINP